MLLVVFNCLMVCVVCLLNLVCLGFGGMAVIAYEFADLGA